MIQLLLIVFSGLIDFYPLCCFSSNSAICFNSFKVGKMKYIKKKTVVRSKVSSVHWVIFWTSFLLLSLSLASMDFFYFLSFVRHKCDYEKMFQMCFQSKTLYRKFAVTPREVWNVLAVPFLPGLFHTFPLYCARSHLPLAIMIVMAWTALWESPEKPQCCGQPPVQLTDHRKDSQI